MKRLIIALIAGVLLIPSAWQSAGAQDDVKREITQIAGDLYRFQNKFHYSVFLVTPAGVIVTDPINAAAAKWLKAQIGVWQFYYEGRDVRDKDLHPATYPIALSTRCMELFTHKGELVLDPFVGSGTTLVSARDTDRNAVGFDLQPEYIGLCEERLSQQQLLSDSAQVAICDDARSIGKYLPEESFISCACHNARFDLNGRVLAGPPPRPLQQFDVRRDEDEGVVVSTRRT